jgi:osmotically inducible protein OsmC
VQRSTVDKEADMAATRQAKAIWNGDLTKGSGAVSALSSRKFSDLPVSWAARTEAPEGRTSPEELLAASHASCFCMALSAGLAKAGTPPQRLETTATVTFDKIGDSWTVVSSALDVTGTVAGIDQATFTKAAEGARDGCPISRALKGNVALSVTARLA